MEDLFLDPVAHSGDTPAAQRHRGQAITNSPDSLDEASIDIYDDLSMSSIQFESTASQSSANKRIAPEPNNLDGSNYPKDLSENEVCSNLDLFTDQLESELSMKSQLKESKIQCDELSKEVQQLKAQKAQLLKNLTSLFITARQEIQEKDKEIADLRATLLNHSSQNKDAAKYSRHCSSQKKTSATSCGDSKRDSKDERDLGHRRNTRTESRHNLSSDKNYSQSCNIKRLSHSKEKEDFSRRRNSLSKDNIFCRTGNGKYDEQSPQKDVVKLTESKSGHVRSKSSIMDTRDVLKDDSRKQRENEMGKPTDTVEEKRSMCVTHSELKHTTDLRLKLKRKREIEENKAKECSKRQKTVPDDAGARKSCIKAPDDVRHTYDSHMRLDSEPPRSCSSVQKASTGDKTSLEKGISKNSQEKLTHVTKNKEGKGSMKNKELLIQKSSSVVGEQDCGILPKSKDSKNKDSFVLVNKNVHNEGLREAMEEKGGIFNAKEKMIQGSHVHIPTSQHIQNEAAIATSNLKDCAETNYHCQIGPQAVDKSNKEFSHGSELQQSDRNLKSSEHCNNSLSKSVPAVINQESMSVASDLSVPFANMRTFGVMSVHSTNQTWPFDPSGSQSATSASIQCTQAKPQCNNDLHNVNFNNTRSFPISSLVSKDNKDTQKSLSLADANMKLDDDDETSRCSLDMFPSKLSRGSAPKSVESREISPIDKDLVQASSKTSNPDSEMSGKSGSGDSTDSKQSLSTESTGSNGSTASQFGIENLDTRKTSLESFDRDGQQEVCNSDSKGNSCDLTNSSPQSRDMVRTPGKHGATHILCTSNIILLGDEETTCTTFASPNKPLALPTEFYPPGVRGIIQDGGSHHRHLRGETEAIFQPVRAIIQKDTHAKKVSCEIEETSNSHVDSDQPLQSSASSDTIMTMGFSSIQQNNRVFSLGNNTLPNSKATLTVSSAQGMQNSNGISGSHIISDDRKEIATADRAASLETLKPQKDLQDFASQDRRALCSVDLDSKFEPPHMKTFIKRQLHPETKVHVIETPSFQAWKESVQNAYAKVFKEELASFKQSLYGELSKEEMAMRHKMNADLKELKDFVHNHFQSSRSTDKSPLHSYKGEQGLSTEVYRSNEISQIKSNGTSTVTFNNAISNHDIESKKVENNLSKNPKQVYESKLDLADSDISPPLMRDTSKTRKENMGSQSLRTFSVPDIDDSFNKPLEPSPTRTESLGFDLVKKTYSNGAASHQVQSLIGTNSLEVCENDAGKVDQKPAILNIRQHTFLWRASPDSCLVTSSDTRRRESSLSPHSSIESCDTPDRGAPREPDSTSEIYNFIGQSKIPTAAEEASSVDVNRRETHQSKETDVRAPSREDNRRDGSDNPDRDNTNSECEAELYASTPAKDVSNPSVTNANDDGEETSNNQTPRQKSRRSCTPELDHTYSVYSSDSESSHRSCSDLESTVICKSDPSDNKAVTRLEHAEDEVSLSAASLSEFDKDLCQPSYTVSLQGDRSPKETLISLVKARENSFKKNLFHHKLNCSKDDRLTSSTRFNESFAKPQPKCVKKSSTQPQLLNSPCKALSSSVNDTQSKECFQSLYYMDKDSEVSLSEFDKDLYQANYSHSLKASKNPKHTVLSSGKGQKENSFRGTFNSPRVGQLAISKDDKLTSWTKAHEEFALPKRKGKVNEGEDDCCVKLQNTVQSESPESPDQTPPLLNNDIRHRDICLPSQEKDAQVFTEYDDNDPRPGCSRHLSLKELPDRDLVKRKSDSPQIKKLELSTDSPMASVSPIKGLTMDEFKFLESVKKVRKNLNTNFEEEQQQSLKLWTEEAAIQHSPGLEVFHSLSARTLSSDLFLSGSETDSVSSPVKPLKYPKASKPGVFSDESDTESGLSLRKKTKLSNFNSCSPKTKSFVPEGCKDQIHLDDMRGKDLASVHSLNPCEGLSSPNRLRDKSGSENDELEEGEISDDDDNDDNEHDLVGRDECHTNLLTSSQSPPKAHRKEQNKPKGSKNGKQDCERLTSPLERVYQLDRDSLPRSDNEFSDEDLKPKLSVKGRQGNNSRSYMGIRGGRGRKGGDRESKMGGCRTRGRLVPVRSSCYQIQRGNTRKNLNRIRFNSRDSHRKDDRNSTGSKSCSDRDRIHPRSSKNDRDRPHARNASDRDGQESIDTNERDGPESRNSRDRERPNSRNSNERIRTLSRDSNDRDRPHSRNSNDRERPNSRNSNERVRAFSRDSNDRDRPRSRNSSDRDMPQARNSSDRDRCQARNSSDRDRPQSRNSSDSNRPKSRNSSDSNRPKSRNSSDRNGPRSRNSSESNRPQSRNSNYSNRSNYRDCHKRKSLLSKKSEEKSKAGFD